SLENLIDISSKRLPSDSVKLFIKEKMDIIFLLNYGKSEITGHTFGYKVFKNSFLNYDETFNEQIKNNNNNNNNNNSKFIQPSFIQIERPREKDGSIIEWNENEELTSKLAKLLDLKIIKPEKIINKYFKEESHIENLESINNQESEVKYPKYEVNNHKSEAKYHKSKVKLEEKLENNEKIRTIYGVSPNENIFVNGVVIGKSNSENLFLVANNGKIIDIIGGTIKDHGIEKLGPIDIDKAIVKTGLLRKSNPKPRIISNENNNKDNELKNKGNDFLKIAFVDHAAEDIYSLKDIDLAVTIGDDTTLVASDILYRFNVPVIGITDGDLDKVVEKGFIAKGSTIIELKPGFDDIVGEAIFKDIFKSQNSLKLSLSSNSSNSENNLDSSNSKDNLDSSNSKDNLDFSNSEDNLDFINNNKSNNKNINKNPLDNEGNKNNKLIDFKNQIFKIVNNITSEYIIKE
ncbi:MAG: DUF2117 domain-containing protein, partial [Methanobrevibacter sp.]|nr:DUF2117 domain-containing protein [Methanobrevibacter sp.]